MIFRRNKHGLCVADIVWKMTDGFDVDCTEKWWINLICHVYGAIVLNSKD